MLKKCSAQTVLIFCHNGAKNEQTVTLTGGKTKSLVTRLIDCYAPLIMIYYRYPRRPTKSALSMAAVTFCDSKMSQAQAQAKVDLLND